MNPVLKYRGGKSREIPRFLQYIPDDFNRYIEPFFGGGAVYFHLEPENAIINDANERLMTFYSQLRDQYPLMRQQLDEIQRVYELNQAEYKRLKALTPDERVPNANEELYYRMRELFNHPDDTYLDGVLYFFINKTAYSGMIRYNNNGDMMNGFDEAEHRRLAADFRNLPCRALMIIGKTPLTEELYGEFIFDEYYKNYAVNIKNRFKNDKMHIVVKNY